MLQDFDKTLENVLVEVGKFNRREIDIAFEQPTSEWSSRLNRPTLNLWCFDLRENVKLRNMERRVVRDNNMGRTTRAPRRMDLTYLVTAWARKVEDEHQMLWRALAVMKNISLLKPQQCEGLLQHSELDIPLTVADMSNNPTNLVDLWSVLDNQMRLGFLLVATIELDIELAIEAPLVLEASLWVGQSDVPPEEELSALDIVLKHKAKKPKQEGKDGE